MNKKQLLHLEYSYISEEESPFIVTDVEYIKNDYLTISERFEDDI